MEICYFIIFYRTQIIKFWHILGVYSIVIEISIGAQKYKTESVNLDDKDHNLEHLSRFINQSIKISGKLNCFIN